jgi:hypothetical protein
MNQIRKWSIGRKILTRKKRNFRGKLRSSEIFSTINHHHKPHVMTWDQTRVSTINGRRKKLRCINKKNADGILQKNFGVDNCSKVHTKHLLKK